MAKGKKYYHYVLVFTESGPVYVTKVSNTDKIAHWEKTEKPLEFSSLYATELALGLSANMHSAVAVTSSYEILSQPYRYDVWDVKWEKKEDK